MIVHINKNYFARGKTGKGKFCQRLVRVLKEKGIEVTEDSKVKADVALHIGRMNYSSKARRNVLRVGPACIDTNMNWRKINLEKAKSVKKADAIIYQSKYSKKIYHKLVRKPDKPETIIFNGADPRDYRFNDVKVEDCQKKYNYFFIASTRVWLNQKRLKQVIKGFLAAEIRGSCLCIYGDDRGVKNKYSKYDNLIFRQSVHSEFLRRALAHPAATCMIHLIWVDACPNSVVEAQVAGLPVICTDQGGTNEILRKGVIIKDHEFTYRPVNLKQPPLVGVNNIAEAIHKVMDMKYSVSKEIDDLYIQNVADRYIKFFKSVL